MVKHANILIVDNDDAARDALSRLLLELGHKPSYCHYGPAALDRIKRTSPDIVLLGVDAAQACCLQILEQIQEHPDVHDIPVIIVCHLEGMGLVAKCFELGADDIVIRPFDFNIMKSRLEGSLRNTRQYDQEVGYSEGGNDHRLDIERRMRKHMQRIARAYLSTLFATAKLIEFRYADSSQHLERIREYCKIVGSRLIKHPHFRSTIDFAFLENLYAVSPLYDIGKAVIPERILLKKTSLTEEEFKIIKTHTVIGADTLRTADTQFGNNEFLRLGIEITENHHEWWDGSGYPRGLAGEEIPISARIVAIADVYDAMTSRRSSEKVFSHEQCHAIILEGKGTQFDPDVVDAFSSAEEEIKKVRSDFVPVINHPREPTSVN